MASSQYNKKGKEHAYKVFTKDLKAGDIPPVVLLTGVEQYLVDWAAEAIKKKFVASGMEDFDFLRIDEENTPARDIIESAQTFPMLSERRVIILKNHVLFTETNPKDFTEKDKEMLLEYIKEPSQSTILVICVELGDDKEAKEKKSASKGKGDGESKAQKGVLPQAKKLARVYDFGPLEYTQLAGFAEKRFKERGVAIDQKTLNHLVNRCGYSNKDSKYHLFDLYNDIQKVIDYGDGKKVTDEDVIVMMGADLETYMFDFVDAVSEKRTERAFYLMQNMLTSGTNPHQILAILIGQFEFILEVKEFKDESMSLAQIKDVLGAHEFRVKKAMAFSDKFSMSKLKELLSSLYDIDKNEKTGLMDAKLGLELLIGKI